MQTIINKYEHLKETDDLFELWQNELSLRKELKNSTEAIAGIQTGDMELVEFLKRSLYYGNRRIDFFSVLLRNMNNHSVLNHFLRYSSSYMDEFLSFVGDYISIHRPPPKDIQFLINIYRPEFNSSFINIIELLDNHACDYLLSRTSNKSLRNLLKDRQLKIEQHKDNENDEYPSIYGDKIKIIASAIDHMTRFKAIQSNDRNIERISLLLDTCDLLFQAGLIKDSLLLLLNIHQQWRQTDVSSSVLEEDSYKRINSLLSRVLPIYGLLINPMEPQLYIREAFKTDFKAFRPDIASLLYLDIYKTAGAGLRGYNKYCLPELKHTAARILSYRPDDILANCLTGNDLASEEQIVLLQDAAMLKMPNYPHETLAILELIRYIYTNQQIRLSSELFSSLLNSYLQLFTWIPEGLIDKEVILQLYPLADESLKIELESITTTLRDYTQDKLLTDYETRPETYYLQNSGFIRILLLGHFMEAF